MVKVTRLILNFEKASHENCSPATIKRILNEWKDMVKNPLEGIKLIPNEGNMSDIEATIEGPGTLSLRRFLGDSAGTPYEGGFFRIKLVLGTDFPQAPPQGLGLSRRS